MELPYKIRIDCQYLKEKDDLSLTLYIKSFSCNFESTAMIVRERQPKDHLHMFILSKLTDKTIRKKIDYLLTERGNKSKSVSDKHDNWAGYRGYLLKHKDTEILHLGTNYNQEDLKNYYLKVSKSVEFKKNSSLITVADSYLKKEGIEWETVHQLTQAVVLFYAHHHKLIHKARIGQLVETLYILKYPARTSEICNEIINYHTGLRDNADREQRLRRRLELPYPTTEWSLPSKSECLIDTSEV